MMLHVDPGDPTPVYEQIRSQVATMIATGVIAEGTQLPPIRQLASDLGLAKGTVARAYELLTREGLVASHGRKGTTVAAPADVTSGASVEDAVAEAAHRYAVRVAQLGLGRESAIAALNRRLDELGAG